MRRIVAIIRFDLANAFRDSMVLYILAAPILLALGLRLLAPAVDSSGAVFAVDASFPRGAALAAELEAYGSVERLDGVEAVLRRVGSSDDAFGVVPGDGPDGLAIALEGDEGDEAGTMVSGVLATILDGSPVSLSRIARPAPRSMLVDYGRVSIAMLAMLIGGVAAAFALVEEKETKETRAFAVSPLGGAEYFAARGLWAAAVGFLGALVGFALAGAEAASLGRFAAAMAASAFMPLSICLLIGGLASNQIQAVASLKVVMLVYLTLPLASLFVPSSLTFLFWAFPNYWSFKAFEGAFVPGVPGFGLSLALSAALGAALVVGLGAALASRLSPRTSGM